MVVYDTVTSSLHHSVVLFWGIPRMFTTTCRQRETTWLREFRAAGLQDSKDSSRHLSQLERCKRGKSLPVGQRAVKNKGDKL